MSVAIVRQPLILSGSSHADREARAKTLVTLFVKFLSDHIDLLVQVRQDFLDKPKTETIIGCLTFGEYCKNVLHYSESHIRRLIAGRNPATRIFDGSKYRVSALPSISEVAAGRPQQRFESGDVILDALINEQNYLGLQLEQQVDNDKDSFSTMLKLATLEGKIINHICSQPEPRSDWPVLVQTIYKLFRSKWKRREPRSDEFYD